MPEMKTSEAAQADAKRLSEIDSAKLMSRNSSCTSNSMVKIGGGRVHVTLTVIPLAVIVLRNLGRFRKGIKVRGDPPCYGTGRDLIFTHKIILGPSAQGGPRSNV